MGNNSFTKISSIALTADGQELAMYARPKKKKRKKKSPLTEVKELMPYGGVIYDIVVVDD